MLACSPGWFLSLGLSIEPGHLAQSDPLSWSLFEASLQLIALILSFHILICPVLTDALTGLLDRKHSAKESESETQQRAEAMRSIEQLQLELGDISRKFHLIS